MLYELRGLNRWIPATLSLIVCSLTVVQTSLGDDELEFRPRQVARPRRAITDAPVIEADEVTNEVNGNELVLGVVVGDEARAYPINMLTGPDREIINDTLAGSAIAATW